MRSHSAYRLSKPKCMARIGARIVQIRRKSSVVPFDTFRTSNEECKARVLKQNSESMPAESTSHHGNLAMESAGRERSHFRLWARKPDAGCHERLLAAASAGDFSSRDCRHSSFLGFSLSPLR